MAAQVQKLRNVLSTMNNPQQALQNMIMQNPNYSRLMNMARSAGSNKQLFAQMTGLDPDEFLRQLNGI